MNLSKVFSALFLLAAFAMPPAVKGIVISMTGFLSDCSFTGLPNPGISAGDRFTVLAVCGDYAWRHGDWFASTYDLRVWLGDNVSIVGDPQNTIACTPGNSVYWWEGDSAVLSADNPGFPTLRGAHLYTALYDFAYGSEPFLGVFEASFTSGGQSIHLSGSTHLASFDSFFVPDSLPTGWIALVLMLLLGACNLRWGLHRYNMRTFHPGPGSST